MAIVSISRLQHRRGLRADLPHNLNEAELGWCLDTRQLFIGNGNTYTGNSQILTQWSPNDQLITHRYVGDTDISAAGTVSRTLGSLLDDTLNVKDYGAVGNGITDDRAAIQQAINDEWARIATSNAAVFSSRNIINFPAGTYAVSGTINLLPFITLKGEGVNRTNIALMSGSVGPVFTTADSLGQTGANIGTNGAVLPNSISVDAMNVDGSSDPTNPVVSLQRCSGVTLNSVKLLGGWTEGSDPSTASPGVTIESLGNAVVTADIAFTALNIKNCSNAIVTSDPVQRISITGSQMVQCYSGINLLGGSNGPSNVQISASKFQDISSYGVYISTTNRGVTSINNSYIEVGVTQGVPAIHWSAGTDSCSSIGDVFSANTPQSRIYNGNPGKNLIFDAQQTGLVTNTPTPLAVVLLNGQTNALTGIAYSTTGVSSFFGEIKYSITMGTYRRSGTLTITSDGTTADLSDSSVQLNTNVSVVFSVTVSGNMIEVSYTSTGSTPGVMNYIQTLWQS
jgi:Pectate lyase superfamily protein/Major tropism determinant N-terminal domain